MKKWYTYIILLASVLFDSCNLEDSIFPEQECETEDITVRIILSMVDSRANTRAASAYDPPHTDDYETTALGNEYYINPYDVEVLVFEADGNFVERATLVQATGPSTNFHTYELTGTLSNVVENRSYQMVVLANRSGSVYCNNFTTPEAGAAMDTFLEELTYTGYNNGFTGRLLEEGSTERIPMWGVVKATLVNNANITVNMLRAMAKVRVNMNITGYTLSSVTLNQANNGGYFTPTMTSGIKTDGSTASVSNPRIPAPASGLTTLTNLPFVSEPNSTSSYVIYVPEMATYSGTETARTATTWMEVAVKDNNDEDVDLGENNKLYFREYRETNASTGVVNGLYFDIVRNYFYDYTITGVEDNSEMTFKLAVKQWDDVEITVPFNNIVSYTVTGWEGNNNLYGYDYYIAKDGNAVLKFQINNPENCDYIVKLSDNTNFTYTKGKDGDNETITISPVNTEPEQYNGKEYETTLSVYAVRSDNGKLVELDMTKSGPSSTGSGTINHYTIKQQWTD